jgi:hypothetical protein
VEGNGVPSSRAIVQQLVFHLGRDRRLGRAGELTQPAALAVAAPPLEYRAAQVVQLHTAVVAARPGVGQRAAQLGVPQQGRQVVEDHGHADVVDGRVREALDRPVRAAAAAEEPEVAGAGQRSCGVEVGRGTRGESAAPA